jgi:hypothetical protein
MSENSNNLRAFGMSGAQIIAELKSFEKKFGLAILPSDGRVVRKIAGYEQFEISVRKSAARMSEYYEIFFCLEVSIRMLVDSMLIEAEGKDYWNSKRIDDDLRKTVNELIREEVDKGITRRSDNPLDYLTFGQLGNVITKNFVLFETVLSSRRAVERVIQDLSKLRNSIAHCCELADDEADRLRLSVRDWFRLFN